MGSKLLFLLSGCFLGELDSKRGRNEHCLRSWGFAVLGRLQQNVRVDYNVIKITLLGMALMLSDCEKGFE